MRDQFPNASAIPYRHLSQHGDYLFCSYPARFALWLTRSFPLANLDVVSFAVGGFRADEVPTKPESSRNDICLLNCKLSVFTLHWESSIGTHAYYRTGLLGLKVCSVGQGAFYFADDVASAFGGAAVDLYLVDYTSTQMRLVRSMHDVKALGLRRFNRHFLQQVRFRRCRFFRYRRLRIQGDQGRGRVRIQVHCISVPLLLIVRFYCLLDFNQKKNKMLDRFIKFKTKLLWN